MDSEFYVRRTFLSEGAVKTNEHNSVLYWLIIERHKHVCKPSSIAISEERRKSEVTTN